MAAGKTEETDQNCLTAWVCNRGIRQQEIWCETSSAWKDQTSIGVKLTVKGGEWDVRKCGGSDWGTGYGCVWSCFLNLAGSRNNIRANRSSDHSQRHTGVLCQCVSPCKAKNSWGWYRPIKQYGLTSLWPWSDRGISKFVKAALSKLLGTLISDLSALHHIWTTSLEAMCWSPVLWLLRFHCLHSSNSWL